MGTMVRVVSRIIVIVIFICCYCFGMPRWPMSVFKVAATKNRKQGKYTSGQTASSPAENLFHVSR
jgi:DNA-binding transcriptional regulator of glucitol operon